DEYCDEGALIGPKQRIRERYRPWADSGATGLTVLSPDLEGLELMAELAAS
ncbi:MAG: LLM class F420-dependent oxidoreductase, partial [Deltaproteobacteria bacterium]|nr:LLM class F420-dependent oxidoreductase [Deltaproteobacteria bacterium]